MITEEVEERFWSKVDAKGDDECWLWKAAKDSEGYGVFSIGARNYKSNIVAWTLFNGRIEPGLLVCHKCDTPACCNPTHLFLGTHTENMQDMSQKGRHGNQKKNYCSRGHEFTPDNTYLRKNGTTRECKKCRKFYA